MIGLVERTDYAWPIGSHATPTPTPAPPERRACDHGITHVCFDVVDLDAEYERMSAAGVLFPKKPRLVANGGAKTTYARDPDGNILELQEVLDPSQPIVLDWMR
jgi:catechol 2,3-dioxygenase-like lactoylglutathione lyase family enzyme